MNPGRQTSFTAGLLVVAILAAYAHTLRAPFVFDDVASIIDNPTIRHLWPPGAALSPPAGWGLTVSGRPVLNLTLAVNYAISGPGVWSYHAGNILIHVLAALTLFGLVRRTLARPPLAARFGGQAAVLAGAIALVWALHPLQTESVTYVIQRAESLMGLFFLLTLYAFVRAADSPQPRRWWTVSFLACLLGTGTKEVAALAPVLVFLYDRTFVSGSFRAAWQRHRWVHLALASTWLPLAWLLAGTGGNRGGTVGFDVGVAWSGYWLTQFEAVTRYLGLACWPHPQVFDYGKITAADAGVTLLWALPVAGLGAATLVALRRWPAAGFLGAWFFFILAPTSLVPGTNQMIVEHRMYLPLAAVIALGLGGVAARFGRRTVIVTGILLALAAGVTTLRRNALYGDERVLWEDTLAKRPGNARAHNNLGRLLEQAGRLDEAIASYQESRRLDPGIAATHCNLGMALMRAGRIPEAATALAEAVRLLPSFANAHLNLGIVLTKLDRTEEALPHFAAALRFDPGSAGAHFQLGIALARLQRWREASAQYAESLQLDPTQALAHSNWGVASFQLKDTAGAIAQFEQALRIEPDLAEVHFNLALALGEAGRWPEAMAHLEKTVGLRPDFAPARDLLRSLKGGPPP